MAYTDEQRAYHREYYVKRRQKSFDIKDNLTLASIIDEVVKCQLLCSPCHARKTAKEASGFTHGTMYGWMKKKCKCAACTTDKWAWHDARNAARRAATPKDKQRGPYNTIRTGSRTR